MKSHSIMSSNDEDTYKTKYFEYPMTAKFKSPSRLFTNISYFANRQYDQHYHAGDGFVLRIDSLQVEGREYKLTEEPNVLVN